MQLYAKSAGMFLYFARVNVMGFPQRIRGSFLVMVLTLSNSNKVR